MSRVPAILLVAALLLAGCVDPNLYTTPRTPGPGRVESQVAPEFIVGDDPPITQPPLGPEAPKASSSSMDRPSIGVTSPSFDGMSDGTSSGSSYGPPSGGVGASVTPPPVVTPNARMGASAAPAAKKGPPAARKGFQMALRAGYMTPFGKAAAATGGNMSDSFTAEGELLLDVGAKISENIFLGAYVGIGLGGTSGQLTAMCSDGALSCSTRTMRGGAEVQYHFAPRGRYNPWVGYGIGSEESGYRAESSFDGSTLNESLSGFEFAHLMAGLDFRLSNGIGIGPTVAFTAAQYSTVTSAYANSGSSDPYLTTSGSITHQSIHEWFLLGARLIYFP